MGQAKRRGTYTQRKTEAELAEKIRQDQLEQQRKLESISALQRQRNQEAKQIIVMGSVMAMHFPQFALRDI